MLSIPWFSAFLQVHTLCLLWTVKDENERTWSSNRSFRFTHLHWKISQPPMLCHNDELRKATDQTFGILCRKANEKNCCHLDRISPQQKCPTFCSTDEDTGTRHKTWTSNMPQKPQSKWSSTLLINHYWAWNTQENEIPEDDQEKCWAVLDNHYFWWNFSLLLKPPAFILYWNSTPGCCCFFVCVCTCSPIFSSPPIFVILKLLPMFYVYFSVVRTALKLFILTEFFFFFFFKSSMHLQVPVASSTVQPSRQYLDWPFILTAKRAWTDNIQTDPSS